MLMACSDDNDTSENKENNRETEENKQEDDFEIDGNNPTESENSVSSENNDDADYSGKPNVPDPPEGYSPNIPDTPEGYEPNVPDAPNVPDPPDVDLPDVDMDGEEDQITLQVPDDLLFDFDKSDLKSNAKKTLDELAKALEEYEGADVEINGHTDNNGGEGYNINLSEERAVSVEGYLDDKNALDDVDVETEGYGETAPIVSNETEEGQQKNRRVEIVIDTHE